MANLSPTPQASGLPSPVFRVHETIAGLLIPSVVSTLEDGGQLNVTLGTDATVADIQAIIPNVQTVVLVNSDGFTAQPLIDPTSVIPSGPYLITGNSLGMTWQKTNEHVTGNPASGYVDIGRTRMQWGVIDANDSADGGTQAFPLPFANANYVVQLTLSETTTIDGPAGTVGVDIWTENLTPTQFGHNRDNDIDNAHIHTGEAVSFAACRDATPVFNSTKVRL